VSAAKAAGKRADAVVGGVVAVKHAFRDLSVPPPEATLVDVLKFRGETQGDETAYRFLHNGEEEKATLTFARLDLKARAIAAAIDALGFGKQKILLSFPPGLDFIEAFFGCLYGGSIAVPVTPPRRHQHGDRLKRIIEDCGASLVVTTSALVDELRSHLSEVAPELTLRYLLVDQVDRPAAILAKYWLPPPIAGEATALLQYTSGSTGSPKGVVVTHQNLVHNARMVKAAFGHSAQTRFVGWLPVYHDMGLIGDVLQPLYLGIPCVLMAPAAFTQKPIRWLRAISRFRATTSGGPNFAYDLCVDKTTEAQRAGLDLSSWRVAYNGSEPVSAATLDRFAATFAPYGFRARSFYPCYGMAEATLFVSGRHRDRVPAVCHVSTAALRRNAVRLRPADARGARALVGCGQSWLDQEIRIANPKTRRSCPDGIIGEIWLRGRSIAQGYLNQTQLTEETFAARLAGEDGFYLRTGDLGFLLEGELYVTGRLKDLIILNGRNHYPQDIERTVARSHEAFLAGSGAAFAVEAGRDERLVIVQEIQRQHLRQADVQELSGAIRESVAREHGVRAHDIALVYPRSVPKTTSDKIRRSACRQAYLSGALALVEDARATADPPAAASDAVAVPALA
jgi:acyl-CoA synthetase (AMP-forming)/AMP-acid ligase II